MQKLFIVVNEDRFFLSHRLPIALAAKNKGYKISILAKNTSHKDEIESFGFRFVEMPINPTGMNIAEEMKTFRFLYNIYRKEKPDIVHHVGLKVILWGEIAASLANIAGRVNAFCGLGGLFNGDGHLSKIATAILCVMRLVNSGKKVRAIFQNDDDLKILTKHKVVSKEQIYKTKGSGIDLKEFNFSPLPDNDLVTIIFTGRMVKEKGVCVLIDAANLIKKDFEGKVRFLLCGRVTPNKSSVTEEYLHEHCDGKYISWLGERNDVKTLLKKSDIVVFPSYYREGIPKSLIEAAAIGRPIITCNTTGCKEVVENGVNGMLVNPRNPQELANALIKLINNPALRNSMSIASRRKAEREYSIEKVIDTHLKIYDSLLENKG